MSNRRRTTTQLPRPGTVSTNLPLYRCDRAVFCAHGLTPRYYASLDGQHGIGRPAIGSSGSAYRSLNGSNPTLFLITYSLLGSDGTWSPAPSLEKAQPRVLNRRPRPTTPSCYCGGSYARCARFRSERRAPAPGASEELCQLVPPRGEIPCVMGRNAVTLRSNRTVRQADERERWTEREAGPGLTS